MMETEKPVIKEEVTNTDVTPAQSNGDDTNTQSEEQLGEFVVLDDLNVNKKDVIPIKDEPGEANDNSDVSDKKDIIKVEADPPAPDNEKNGDSLILTADEDLETVSPSTKANSDTVTVKTEDLKQEAMDSTATSETNTESQETPKAENEKTPPKNQRVLWVSNISKTIKATDLKQYLSKAGKVTTTKIVTDGKRCFGYVLMELASDAIECVKTLNNTNFDGKNIILSFDKPTKGNQTSKSNAKKATDSSKPSDPKRAEKRRHSSTKNDSDKSKSSSESKSKAETSTESLNKTTKSTDKKIRSRSRDRYIRERNERDRLRRRIIQEERKNYEARLAQIQTDERQREKEFRLEQERRKLQMERELFEKQKREWARINDERRKLERARLEIEQQRVKLEEDLKKEQFKRKSPDLMPSVVSKITDPNKKNAKMMKRDDYKNSYEVSAPPPPKLGMDFDIRSRKSSERKMGRSVDRKIDVMDRKFYGDGVDRKKQYGRKEFEESKPYMKRYPGEREGGEHRTQWSPPVGSYGSGVGMGGPRYQDSMPSQQFTGGQPSRAPGYYYHPSTSTPDFPRYDQIPNRKY